MSTLQVFKLKKSGLVLKFIEGPYKGADTKDLVIMKDVFNLGNGEGMDQTFPRDETVEGCEAKIYKNKEEWYYWQPNMDIIIEEEEDPIDYTMFEKLNE